MKYNSGSNSLKTKKWYVMMGVCLLLAALLSWIGVSKALKDMKENNQQLQNQTQTPVNEAVKDVPKPSQPSASQPAPSTTTDSSDALKGQSDGQKKPSAPVYTWPVKGGKVLHGFSNEELVKSKTMGDWRTHNGVDIGAPAGSDVVAVTKGVVEQTGEDPMWGGFVKIKGEDGLVYLYCNLEAGSLVPEGSEVAGGKVIGQIGKTAQLELLEEDHLHLEVKKGETYVSPETKIGTKEAA